MASLALYWSVMIACYLLASRLRRYADRLGFVNTLLSVSVYALVFVMGLRMGANREVTDNLGVIGVQALLVTALTMAFSMLGAFAVRRALHIDRNALPRGAEKTAAEPSAAAHADASGSKTSLIIFAMVAAGMLLGYFVVPRVTDPDAFQAVSGSWLVVGLCLLLAFVGSISRRSCSVRRPDKSAVCDKNSFHAADALASAAASLVGDASRLCTSMFR